jgi:hypothetical protein
MLVKLHPKVKNECKVIFSPLQKHEKKNYEKIELLLALNVIQLFYKNKHFQIINEI